MSLAAILRAEAAWLREFATSVTEPEVLAEVLAMIAECDRLARDLDNGDARSSAALETHPLDYEFAPGRMG